MAFSAEPARFDLKNVPSWNKYSLKDATICHNNDIEGIHIFFLTKKRHEKTWRGLPPTAISCQPPTCPSKSIVLVHRVHQVHQVHQVHRLSSIVHRLSSIVHRPSSIKSSPNKKSSDSSTKNFKDVPLTDGLSRESAIWPVDLPMTVFSGSEQEASGEGTGYNQGCGDFACGEQQYGQGAYQQMVRFYAAGLHQDECGDSNQSSGHRIDPAQ